MLDLRRLAVLRAYAAEGTIVGAAEALAFTPSAVSQQLAQLQREAGVPLLRRSGRRLELTDAGRTLVERASELLDRVEEVQAELATHAGQVRGVVRVAGFQTAALELAVPAIERVRNVHPAVAVEIVELDAEESLPLLARGGVDIAIAEEYDHAPRRRVAQLDRRYLAPDELVVVLPRDHPASRRAGRVRLADLADTPWATARTGTAYADMFARICRAVAGFEPEVRHRAGDMRLLLDLVARAGVAALLPALGRPERDERVVVRRPEEDDFARAIFAATRRSDRRRPATAAVLDAIADVSATR